MLGQYAFVQCSGLADTIHVLPVQLKRESAQTSTTLAADFAVKNHVLEEAVAVLGAKNQEMKKAVEAKNQEMAEALEAKNQEMEDALAAALVAKKQEMEKAVAAAREARDHDVEQMRIALGAKEESLDEATSTIDVLKRSLKVRRSVVVIAFDQLFGVYRSEMFGLYCNQADTSACHSFPFRVPKATYRVRSLSCRARSKLCRTSWRRRRRSRLRPRWYGILHAGVSCVRLVLVGSMTLHILSSFGTSFRNRARSKAGGRKARPRNRWPTSTRRTYGSASKYIRFTTLLTSLNTHRHLAPAC